MSFRRRLSNEDGVCSTVGSTVRRAATNVRATTSRQTPVAGHTYLIVTDNVFSTAAFSVSSRAWSEKSGCDAASDLFIKLKWLVVGIVERHLRPNTDECSQASSSSRHSAPSPPMSLPSWTSRLPLTSTCLATSMSALNHGVRVGQVDGDKI
jgi:hypothetical protein